MVSKINITCHGYHQVYVYNHASCQGADLAAPGLPQQSVQILRGRQDQQLHRGGRAETVLGSSGSGHWNFVIYPAKIVVFSIVMLVYQRVTERTNKRCSKECSDWVSVNYWFSPCTTWFVFDIAPHRTRWSKMDQIASALLMWFEISVVASLKWDKATENHCRLVNHGKSWYKYIYIYTYIMMYTYIIIYTYYTIYYVYCCLLHILI